MKRIAFCRKSILRAIHAAALALYFALAAAANAQTATGDGHGNITISGTGNNAFVLGPLSTPPLASGGTLTISSGASTTVGGGSSTSSAYAIQILTPSTTSNSGSLSAFNNNNFSGGPAATLDISPLTTAGNVTIKNNGAGMISASSYMGSATAVDIENVQQGSIFITNSGHISAAQLANGQASTVVGIFANDTYAQGSITFGNTGTISPTGTSSNGYGAILSTSGSGGISVTNSGTINENTINGESVAGEGLDLTSSGSGAITVNNNGGTVTGSSSYGMGIGINANASGNGAVTITNTGAVTGSNSTYNRNGLGINVSAGGSGAISVQNGGTITASASSVAFGLNSNDTGTGTTTLTNSGAISATGQSGANGISLVSSSGNGLITNSGPSIQATSANGAADAIYIYTPFGTGNVTNTGALTSTGGTSASGIYVYAHGVGAPAYTITNSGAIQATSTASSGFLTVSDIFVLGGNSIQITNRAAITAVGTGSNTYSIGISANGGSISISNFAPIHATSSGGGSYGIDAVGSTLTVTNSQAITSVSASGYAYGLLATGVNGGASVTNSGSIGVSGSNLSDGIFGSALASNLNLTNSGAVMVTSSANSASGLYASASNGNITLTNSGHVVAASQSGTFTASGITASAAGTGSVGITNNGNMTASGYNAFGINATASGSGIVTIGNTGGISIASSGAGSMVTSSAIYGATNTGDLTISNSGTLTVNAFGDGTGISGLIVSNPATININNRGTISVTTHSNYTNGDGIYADSLQNSIIVNSGAITVTDDNQTFSGAYGIYGFGQNGDVSITNSGAVSASASSEGGCAAITGNGAEVTINNTGAITSTGSAVYGTTGISATASVGAASVSNYARISTSGSSNSTAIQVVGTASASVSNSGALTVTSTAHAGTGITASANNGPTTVSNTGSLIISGSSGASGITSTDTAGPVSVTNLGRITATSTNGSARGIFTSSGGEANNVVNSGTLSATTQTGNAIAYGMDVEAGMGAIGISNSGTSAGTAYNGGTGYGIYVDPNGPIVVTNTGSAIGTTTGIYLASAGTVNNYGLASGGTYSIQVPTASTVNLHGASPVLGLLKGGANASSTSALNFDIVIRRNYSAQKMSLDDAIAAYGTAYAAAGGMGNVDSSVVVLNRIDYQWEDFLDITDNLIQGRLYEQTPGDQGIGTAIDNFDTGNTRGVVILAALDNLPDSSVANALAQLSPKALQVFRSIAFDGASFTAANVNNHLANQRDGLTGFDTSGFSVNTPGVDPMLSQMRSRLLAFDPAPADHGLLSDSSSSLLGAFDPKDMKAMVNTQPVDPWSAFISGSVILANLDNTTSNIGDSDYTTGSVLAGVDYRLDDHFTVGALFNYAHTSATLDGNGSKATVDSYSPGIYGSYVNKGWYGDAMLMYGFNNNTDDRQVTIPGIAGDNHGASNGGQLTSNFTGGYEFQRGPFKFGPIASLQYVHLTVGSFQEQGPTSLSIDRQKADSLRTQLGFEARYSTQSHTPFGLMTFTPHFQASWQHEYMDNSDGISSQFNGGAGGGSFVVQGQQPERDSAFLDLGLDAEVARNVTLFVDYQTQAGQNDFFAQSAQGGVRIGF